MSDNDLIRRGDAREILEDEGFLERSLERLAAIPAVQPDDAAALVEAAENVLDNWYAFDSLTTGMHDLETALARVKGVM